MAAILVDDIFLNEYDRFPIKKITEICSQDSNWQ